MRRAVLAVLIVALLPALAPAQSEAPSVDAVGLLNFRAGPRFKPGDWVRIHTSSTSERGYNADYTVTALIAGDERWWGEDCFWVESITEAGPGNKVVTATLVSYAVFQDTLPKRRFVSYIRKYINSFDDDGKPIQELFQRSSAELTQRRSIDYGTPHTFDTLGVETIETPKGKLPTIHVRDFYKEGATRHEGDSTIYFERSEERMYWYSDSVPIIGMVRMDHDNAQKVRSWLVGESKNAELRVLERARGSTVVVDWGTGMKSELIDPRFGRPQREQDALQERPAVVPRPKRAAGRSG